MLPNVMEQDYFASLNPFDKDLVRVLIETQKASLPLLTDDTIVFEKTWNEIKSEAMEDYPMNSYSRTWFKSEAHSMILL